MLRVDPQQRQRLTDIIDNLQQRLHEAHERRWLGEVQGLQISLDAARAKLATVDRLAGSTPSGPTMLGLPSYPPRPTPPNRSKRGQPQRKPDAAVDPDTRGRSRSAT
ncbi:MAG TPA: hypothetical protein VJT31_32155, partial [Rugosimonospora sp.]|nr:hypothetical protein [Rugosimonospora sp.]